MGVESQHDMDCGICPEQGCICRDTAWKLGWGGVLLIRKSRE